MINAAVQYKRPLRPGSSLAVATPAHGKVVNFGELEESEPRNIIELLQMSAKKNVGVLATRTVQNRPASRTQVNAPSR